MYNRKVINNGMIFPLNKDERDMQEYLAKTTDQYLSWTWKQAYVTQRSLSNTRLSHHSRLPPIYYHQMLQYFPRPPKAFISHQLNCCSPCFPPSWHHRALHHISHLSEAQHCPSFKPPIRRALLPHTTATSLLELSHPSQCFPSPEAQYSTSQPYPIPQAPWGHHLPSDSHSTTLTHADSMCFPPLGTELPHSQQSLPLHTGLTLPIPCTSISSGGCSHPPRCWEAWPAGKHEEFKPAKVSNRGWQRTDSQKWRRDADGEVREKKGRYTKK